MPESPPPPLRLLLDDGTPVLLRPILADDAHYLREGLERLSVESRITRFFSPISHLSDDQLDYLANVDQDHHVAWGALDLSTDEVLGIGVGRFARLETDPHTAEVAIAVLDDYQRHGLGGLLLGVLYRIARAHGIETLRAVVMAQNNGLAERLRALGGTAHFDGDTVTVDLPVVDDAALPDTPDARHLAGVLQQIDAALDLPPTPRTKRSRRRKGGPS